MTTPTLEAVPYVLPRWFYVKDTPTPSKQPSWLPFKKSHSVALEYHYLRLQAYLQLHSPSDPASLHSLFSDKQNLAAPPHINNVSLSQLSAYSSDPQPPTDHNSLLINVAVNEDLLYQVNLLTMQLSPIYWNGDSYAVRRGIWFQQSTESTSNFVPLDDNLSMLVEDGYVKLKPWVVMDDGNSTEDELGAEITPTIPSESNSGPDGPDSGLPSGPQGPASSKPETTESSGPSGPASVKPLQPSSDPSKPSLSSTNPIEKRYPLPPPFQSQSVLYTSPTTAYLQSDSITQKISSVLSSLTKGVSGIKVIRGWSEVEKEKKRVEDLNSGKKKNKDSGKEEKKDKEEKDEVVEEEEDDGGVRKIDHLVFVIHGIGQKLGETMKVWNFVGDVGLLRKTLKSTATSSTTTKSYFPTEKPVTSTSSSSSTATSSAISGSGSIKKSGVPVVPVGSGVQVLPVVWRQKMDFGKKTSEKEKEKSKSTTDDEEGEKEKAESKELKLEDITLEGVPSIRMIVSDVILDVLLYMTPTYRQQMIQHVTSELNRLYNLYKLRNPTFSGTISIYGHSLGSVLGFDILCHQFGQFAVKLTERKESLNVGSVGGNVGGGEEDEGSSVGSLGDAEVGDGEKSQDGDGGIGGLIADEKVEIKYGQLEFRVDKFFAVGSPVGLFMLLRGDVLRPRVPNVAYLSPVDGVARPAVKSMYNMFHPHDPVAYRIEPLVLKEYAKNKPVSMTYTKGGIKGTIVGIQEASTEFVNQGFSAFEKMKSDVFGSAAKVASMVIPKSTASTTSAINQTASPTTENEGWKDAPLSGPGTNSGIGKSGNGNVGSGRRGVGGWTRVQVDETDLSLLNTTGRVDYEIQENLLENPYIASLGAHLNYWGDLDCAVFLVRQLYQG